MDRDALEMVDFIVGENMPQGATVGALEGHCFGGSVYMVAIGKAAWTMAQAACGFLGDRLKAGLVVTKYGHSQGVLPACEIYEAGHPISDENTIVATQKCISLAEGLGSGDELLFLVSGGGSALFEAPLPGLSLAQIQDIGSQLLASGADIVEINMLRKRLSAVKAGRFAMLAAPAKIFSIVLSDVLGDRLDSIASGPAAADSSTSVEAIKVAEKYKITLTDLQQKYLMEETPKEINNVKTVITGSFRTLCESAAKAARRLGYQPFILTTQMNCEASEAGRLLSAIAQDTHHNLNSFKKPCAIIAGGETVVTLKGTGKGGRNQEIALSAAKGIANLPNTLIFSLASDGTDGPTNAAGAIVTGSSASLIKNLDTHLANNNSNPALQSINALITTGPTGTNVNDVTVILCR